MSTDAAAVIPTKDYTSHCHCKAVTFTINQIPDLQKSKVISCNCSICTDRGQLVTFVPASSIKFTPPECEQKLKTYSFNKHMVKYRFCSECGSHMLGGFEGQSGVNVRCIDGIDIKTLDLQPYDGAAL